MDEWISVKDRLPDYNQEVLFVSGKNEVSVGIRFQYQEGVDIWASNEGIYFNDSIQQEWAVCKYWMPLPSKPDEE
jgi:Protein of unknown function (DUF551)